MSQATTLCARMCQGTFFMTGKELVYDIIWFQKYDVIKILGQGGMGTVFLAENIHLHAERAIKRIPKELAEECWRREIEVLTSIRHENIPIIYDLEEDENYIYIIEEYIEGESLRTYRNRQKLNEPEIVSILLQLCDVLHFLHSLEPSVLYLDLKPDNLLITKQHQLKLIDFGTAVILKAQTANVLFGTRVYAAPEIVRHESADIRSDIYGIGEIIHFCMYSMAYQQNQEKRWLRSGFWKQNPYYSQRLREIMKRCVRENPKERYASVNHIKKELLTLGNYEQHQEKEFTPYIITVAGTMRRIGVTHICFLLATCLSKLGMKPLYVEQNTGQVIEALHLWGKEKMGFPIVRGNAEELKLRYPEHDVLICDCGCIENGKDAYSEGMLKVMVVGGKPWEQTEWLPDGEEMILVNFADENGFSKIKKKMGENCIQIPYQIHLEQAVTDKTFMKKVKQNFYEKACKEKRTKCRRKK